MSRRINRRRFMQTTAAVGAAGWMAGHAPAILRAQDGTAMNKLNIGIIGCGGMGGGNHDGVRSENIVAVCDVDSKILEKGLAKSPQAKGYADFRELLDKHGKELDAVVVSTPDHTHAVASVMAMSMGLHCYCEKPLTHDVYEARVMQKVAAGTKAKGGGKLATQMGNRGTAENGFRRGVELLQAGIIGPVREVHIWSNRPIWPQGMTERPKEKPTPEHLSWDLWLGTAPERPYGDGYHTFAWRGWWDFGTGALGDMACHTTNLTYMGLKLGSPTTIEAEVPGISKEAAPKWCIIRYEFPARGELPPVKLTWYDGGKKPAPEITDKVKMYLKDGKVPGSGAILIGDNGVMFSPDDYGTQQFVNPKELRDEFDKKVEQSIPRAKGGHYREWLSACKGEIPQALSNFDYAGPLTEFVLLGNVSLRVGSKITWDSENLKADVKGADEFIKREYRKGWTLGATA